MTSATMASSRYRKGLNFFMVVNSFSGEARALKMPVEDLQLRCSRPWLLITTAFDAAVLADWNCRVRLTNGAAGKH
jgi:hypothetical protein